MAATRPNNIDLEQLARTEGEGLIAQLVSQRARLQTVIELALDTGALHQAISAEARITENLSLLTKLLGQLVNVTEVRHQHELLVHPEYLAFRAMLLQAAGTISRRLAWP
jgi:hypothetical protein